jgi:16S rRNA (adenine1518-N6/adenine1519-N6)-dimethyltransferase
VESKTSAHKETLRPNKRLGQHFLRDQSVIAGIIDRSGFIKSDDVLEIGPGLGALTIPLAGQVNTITAVEKDRLLADTLRMKLMQEGIVNVNLINDDILKTDWDQLRENEERKLKVVGNLPYNISSPILERLFRHKGLASEAVFMFQYEFAERLLASPGGKDYGALTVMVRYDAEVSPVIHVASDAFYPRPKVGSMVVRIDLQKPHSRRALDENLFRIVVKGAFAHRRKTIINSLRGSLSNYESDAVREALRLCAIDPIRRAETVDIDEFINLADTLYSLEAGDLGSKEI